MAKSRKKPAKAPKLKGGVGEAPAGRGGFADQLFQARETAKPGSGRNMTEYDALPEPDPNPENRFIEDFQTVGDDLRKTMASNRNDPGKVPAFASMADAMTSMMDELPRESDPDMRTRMAEAANAYQRAWQSQSPEQQAHILSFVSPNRQADFSKFYGRDAIVDFNQGGQINLPFMEPKDATGDQALRAARATSLDYNADEADYLDRGGVDGRRPYDLTDRGQAQLGMLANLIGEGVDPADIDAARMGEAALTPYSPGPGVYLTREDLPAEDALSAYIGGDMANQYRPDEVPRSGGIGKELLGQYHAVRDKGMEPVLASLLDETQYNPAAIWPQSQDEADALTAIQMRSPIVQNQEELWRRAFGDDTSVHMMDSSRGALSTIQADKMGGLPNIARLAGEGRKPDPWIDSLIQQVMPDGSIGHGDWTPEQVARTIISQNKFLAEQPYLREAALQRLLPDIALALEARRSARGLPDRTFDRSPAGKALLLEEGGNLNSMPQPPAEAPRPAGPTPAQLQDSIQKALKNRRMPGKNDMGFAEPMSLPPYMAGAMPNRLLSSLIG